jgi:hypothetical protein
MNRTLQTGSSLIVSAFESALLHQLLGVVLVLVVLMVAFNVLRSMQYRRAVAAAGPVSAPGSSRAGRSYREPAARRVLRIGFGLLWLFDGILQGQSSMPLGMATGVLKPAASSSPGWVRHVVNVGVGIWSRHPVTAAAAAVWIQVGIGVLLLVAPRGRWSRCAGLVSVGWGLVVWVFGEAFGDIFGHGLTWAFGSPGAAAFYVVAGALIALPERAWEKPLVGRAVTSAMGVFFPVWPFCRPGPVAASGRATSTAPRRAAP